MTIEDFLTDPDLCTKEFFAALLLATKEYIGAHMRKACFSSGGDILNLTSETTHEPLFNLYETKKITKEPVEGISHAELCEMVLTDAVVTDMIIKGHIDLRKVFIPLLSLPTAVEFLGALGIESAQPLGRHDRHFDWFHLILLRSILELRAQVRELNKRIKTDQ